MNKKKCFIAWVLMCSMLVFYIPSMASEGSEENELADTKVDVQITLEYRQKQARTILDMVNEFRTGDNAWFWNEDNQTKTTYQPNQLSALTYDYTLEAVAMQRAAEIALNYSHTRTNGESCFTAFTEAGYSNASRGENIAVNQSTPEEVFIDWREDNDNYSGQGHRRNMLNADMRAIGIGYAYYNGTHYWTMELGSVVTEKTDSGIDGKTEAEITVLDSYIESLSTKENTYTVACDGEIDVPEVDTQMITEDTWTWPKGQKVSGVIVAPEWTVEDAAVAEISNGKIIGKKVGTTVLTAKAGAKSVQVALNVTGVALTDANTKVVLPDETFVYNGNAIEPEPTVTYNETLLEKGKDYTVSYSNNIEAGTNAQVIVKGIGNYSGEIVKNFTISTCAHKWNNGVVTEEATCTKDGIKTITCEVCNETKTEPIPATGHKWDNGVVTEEATCTKDGVKTTTCETCNDTKTEVIPATGHKWDNGVVTEEATCTKDGVKTTTCEACNEVKTEPIPATGHKWDNGVVTEEATCTEDGVKTTTCETCNDTKTEPIPATGHKWDNGVVTEEATCTKDGVKTTTCEACNEVKTEVIPATGHKWDSGTITKEPTCTETGIKTITCTICKTTKTEPIPLIEHSWDSGTITKEPTCTENGIKTIACISCGKTETEVIKAIGHKWDNGTVTKTPACIEDGVKTFVCANCEETRTEVIPAIGHSYGEPVFTWAEDYSSAAADFICTKCEDVNTVSASITVEVDKNITCYTASVIFNETTYKEEKKILSMNEESRIVISDNSIEIPETLGKYTSKEEIMEAFAQEIKKTEGYSGQNMTVYDVHLQININGKWEDATKENFPKEGITITIPYPEGIDGTKYDFVVTHMITYDINNYKAGDIETLAAEKTEDGLQFKVMSLSPISIAWKEMVIEKETTTLTPETITSSNNEKNTSNNNETTTLEKETTTNSIKTGDNTSIMLWIVLGLSAACGCLITGWKKQKKHSA